MRSSVTPTTIAAVVIVGGVFGLSRARERTQDDHIDCDPVLSECRTDPSLLGGPVEPPQPAPTSAADTCRNVGYLCADLASLDRIRLQHWKDFVGPMVIRVPRPDFESAGDATRLQQSAATGLRAWNRQPFEIVTDLQGDREADFSVTWARGLGGSQLGVTRTQWSAATGLRVISIELTTRNPFDPTILIEPEQVRLTAAHEMGHALGLPHSDSERDVMYPTNTATSLTAQDYRTMESLYSLPDGMVIVR